MNILMLAPLKKENYNKIEEAFPSFHFTYSKNIDVTQAMIDESDIIVGNPPFSVDLNKQNIKAILLNSAGSDQYIKKGLLHPQTILTNASGTYGKAIAEHTIGMILALNKNIKTYVKQMNEHLWRVVPTGKEIYHSHVVIVGLGDLGYEIAKRLKAFDCYIIGVKRTQSDLLPCVDKIYTTEHLDEILPQADFVISTLPQTKETIHLFNKEKFLRMKEDAVFVNVGRGSAVDTNDLMEVLDQGHLYGVALDVLEQEPLSLYHRLWDYDQVIITPHASGGYVWESTRQYYTDLVIRNIKHLQNNEELENEVDFETGYRKKVQLK